MNPIDLAISPCPNDTFIFHALQQRGLAGHPVRLEFADVEELNRRALEEARHMITKLSFFAMLHVRDRYELLPTGGALGRGCGPLLITRRAAPAPDFVRHLTRILIPGRYTTANLLTRLYLKSQGVDPGAVEFVPTRYDRIIPELLAGSAEFGVIIHEERFTYQARGLHAVQDLGEWWEQTTGAPIPLGCIALRNDAPEDVRAAVTPAIQASVAAAWAAPEDPGLRAFVKRYSQELADDVIQAHIDLYVNDFTRDIGAAGRRAIDELFARAGSEMNA